MITLIEAVIGLIAVLGLVTAFFAHKDHLSLKDEANKEIAEVKTEAKNALADLEARVRALENKGTPATTPAVSAPVAAVVTPAKPAA